MANIVYTASACSTHVLSQASDCTDKGKPAARQGHKAVSLAGSNVPVFEIVWLPKAIGEKPAPQLLRVTTCGSSGWASNPSQTPFTVGSQFFPFLSSLINYRQPGPCHELNGKDQRVFNLPSKGF
jgi:hypothetical protein